MLEHLIVRSFGPIKEIDITFRKITIFIGDQGTGKSCIAKLFSMFKWLEKALMTEKYTIEYFERYIDARLKKQLFAYHRIDEFFSDDSYILYESGMFRFVFDGGTFRITHISGIINGLSKIMYVPAERIILSSAEKKLKTFDGLPASNLTFNQEFWESKDRYKEGYDLPFGKLKYKYDSLNDISWIVSGDYRVRLINASSGVQSALPVCMVSEYLSGIVSSGKDRTMSVDELQKIQKETRKIMENGNLSDTVKDAMLAQLSGRSRYDCFVNIVEEPELSLFPKSQNEMIKMLCKVNNDMPGNMLVITSHSPYTLAILNTLVLAFKVFQADDEEIKRKVEDIVPRQYHVDPTAITAVRLSEDDRDYSLSILSEASNMIAKNDLDSASDIIMKDFNSLYSLYAKVVR